MFTKKFTLANEGEIPIDKCDQDLKYLSHVLQNEEIPFKERKEEAYSALTKYLNLKTTLGRWNYLLCMLFIISILFNNNETRFLIIMKSLIKFVK